MATSAGVRADGLLVQGREALRAPLELLAGVALEGVEAAELRGVGRVEGASLRPSLERAQPLEQGRAHFVGPAAGVPRGARPGFRDLEVREPRGRFAPADDVGGGAGPDLLDGDSDSVGVRGAGTARRHHGRREDRASGQPGSRQSTGFGGGPIWMRSPRYEPTIVNITPIPAMITYMNDGITRTVCPK